MGGRDSDEKTHDGNHEEDAGDGQGEQGSPHRRQITASREPGVHTLVVLHDKKGYSPQYLINNNNVTIKHIIYNNYDVEKSNERMFT